MKRSELIAWLFAEEVRDGIKDTQNPKVRLTTANKEFSILSVYDNEGTIWIDIGEVNGN